MDLKRCFGPEIFGKRKVKHVRILIFIPGQDVFFCIFPFSFHFISLMTTRHPIRQCRLSYSEVPILPDWSFEVNPVKLPVADGLVELNLNVFIFHWMKLQHIYKDLLFFMNENVTAPKSIPPCLGSENIFHIIRHLHNAFLLIAYSTDKHN